MRKRPVGFPPVSPSPLSLVSGSLDECEVRMLEIAMTLPRTITVRLRRIPLSESFGTCHPFACRLRR